MELEPLPPVDTAKRRTIKHGAPNISAAIAKS
jgi:hypothetical protein